MSPDNGFLISIQSSDLVDLLAGKRPEIEIATLPLEVRKYLGCSRDTVFLSSESARHIVRKHGDHISHDELRLLPRILFTGLWLGDERLTHAISSCVIDGVRFKAVVKVTVDRRRTYVKTLHRVSRRQTRSLLRDKKRLRESWD